MQPSEPASHLLQMFSQAVRNGAGQFVVAGHLLAIIKQPSEPKSHLLQMFPQAIRNGTELVCSCWPSSCHNHTAIRTRVPLTPDVLAGWPPSYHNHTAIRTQVPLTPDVLVGHTEWVGTVCRSLPSCWGVSRCRWRPRHGWRRPCWCPELGSPPCRHTGGHTASARAESQWSEEQNILMILLKIQTSTWTHTLSS